MQGETFRKDKRKVFVLVTGLEEYLISLRCHKLSSYYKKELENWISTVQGAKQSLGNTKSYWILFELELLAGVDLYTITSSLMPVNPADIRAIFLTKGYKRTKGLSLPTDDWSILVQEVVTLGLLSEMPILEPPSNEGQQQLTVFIKGGK
ncbi:MAG: hypothetical protein GF308_11695 [Candidatus Heimdallarchaeota archaeon]|nr:hypothetical protein [Candidatus Heimdallarchaeota archaeon]